ncbi:MAG TPA: 2-oxo acid dehydrogenase subunit E2, partial [Acidimicrobiia bacterium]
MPTFEEYGPNSGFFEDMHRRYLENPSAVGDRWRAFFDRLEGEAPPQAPEPAPALEPAPAHVQPPTPAPGPPPERRPERPEGAEVARPANERQSAPLVLPGEDERVSEMKGASARIVENMEASLGVPTATSVRTVPAKLLEVNRMILNNHLGRTTGAKVSFTHLIAYAVLRALERVPAMNSGFGFVSGQPVFVRHEHVNLGLAVDVKKSDGSHTLVVPNVRDADTLDFARFHAAYEMLIEKVRSNQLSPDDFAGTTGTITNPGTIGTVHSVPRLMPGQGFIIGVGAIGFPAEYEGADPQTLAKLGVSKTITLTSTYDHRIIQGAESGEFLAVVHRLLVGDEGFYDEIFKSFSVPYEPARWSVDISAAEEDSVSIHDKAVHVQQLINMYRVRGHLIANLDPLGRKDPDTHSELDI